MTDLSPAPRPTSKLATRRSALLSLLAIPLAASIGCHHHAQPSSAADSASAKEEPSMRLADAADVVATIAGDGTERRIPVAIATKTRCVAVVPALVQGALFVGAKHGHGVMTCRTGGTEGPWSAPAFFVVTGGTAGLQVGVESVDLVMLVLTEHGQRAFASRELRLGGDVSATAGPEGRGRAEDTDASLRSEIVSYSRSRGLFAGIDVSGAVVRPDPDATRAFYGQDEPVATTLETPATTPSAAAFLARVRAAF
jgi:SH3 domain-containing YSC84-like protein 1